MILGTQTTNLTIPAEIFTDYYYIQTQKDLDKVDCLVLWGGEDIGTEIYGEVPNKFVWGKYASKRDKYEMYLINQAIKRGLPILGICRGAQLLCCMAGGKLLQHIEDHGKDHDIIIKETGEKLFVTSSHHQMMLPPVSANILAIADKPTIGVNQYNGYTKVEEVPEVVHFPNINALGVQPHPEWLKEGTPFIIYINTLLKEKLQWITQP